MALWPPGQKNTMPPTTRGPRRVRQGPAGRAAEARSPGRLSRGCALTAVYAPLRAGRGGGRAAAAHERPHGAAHERRHGGGVMCTATGGGAVATRSFSLRGVCIGVAHTHTHFSLHNACGGMDDIHRSSLKGKTRPARSSLPRVQVSSRRFEFLVGQPSRAPSHHSFAPASILPTLARASRPWSHVLMVRCRIRFSLRRSLTAIRALRESVANILPFSMSLASSDSDSG